MGGGDQAPSRYEPQMTQITHKAVPRLRLVTHNIRYAATSLFPHERPWSERLPNLRRQFRHHTSLPFNPASTIVCLQEVLHPQLCDLSNAFGAEWTFVGVGRDDGKEAGEYNPIFYQHKFWDKVHSETIWLSPTPDRPGRGWDAGSNRLCSCLILQDRGGEMMSRKIMILNTHLDNAGPEARREGARLILRYADQWRDKFCIDHILLAGDLNSMRDEKDGAWEMLNAKNSSFKDVETLLQSESPDGIRRFGDQDTFTGFDGNGDEDEVGVLDFVHYGLGKDESWHGLSLRVSSFMVVPNLFDDGVRCSDHRAVVVDLMFGGDDLRIV